MDELIMDECYYCPDVGTEACEKCLNDMNRVNKKFHRQKSK